MKSEENPVSGRECLVGEKRRKVDPRRSRRNKRESCRKIGEKKSAKETCGGRIS